MIFMSYLFSKFIQKRHDYIVVVHADLYLFWILLSCRFLCLVFIIEKFFLFYKFLEPNGHLFLISLHLYNEFLGFLDSSDIYVLEEKDFDLHLVLVPYTIG